MHSRRMRYILVRKLLYSLPTLEELEMLILTYRLRDYVVISWKIVKQLENFPFSLLASSGVLASVNLDFGKKSFYTRSKEVFCNQVSLGFSAYSYLSGREL